MKKICKFLLVAVMVLGLAGCMSDPVETEFDNFHEVMKNQVVADLDAFTLSAEKAINNAVDAKEFERITKEEVIPAIDRAREKIENVAVETEKIKELKDKFINAMNVNKDAQDKLVNAIITGDLDNQESVNKSNEAATLMNEFNQAYKDLATELGYEFES